MVKVICGETKLKSHDFRLRGSLRTILLCENCTSGEIEDPVHVFIICTANKVRREQLDSELCRELEAQWDTYEKLSQREKLKVLLGLAQGAPTGLGSGKSGLQYKMRGM